MVMDFGDVSKAIVDIIENKLDHHYLNETLPLLNPTSEEVARWLFAELKPKLPMLCAVVINETCTSSCTYEP